MHDYGWLLSRLDEFIRKYYANKLLRGALVFFSCLLFYILSVSLGEYFLYFPVWVKITLLSFLVIAGTSALIAWVAIPLAQMAKLGNVISYEQAAQIIGRHFPEISDQLLNILQLKNTTDGTASRELIEAGINQKISNISVVPIAKAVEFSKNKKYVPYLGSAILLILLIAIAAPKIFSESSKRLLQPTTVFEKPAPFQFLIKNANLLAPKNSDFTLVVATKGSALPAEAFVCIGDEKLPMQPLENHSFQYTFRNLTTAVSFRLSGGGYFSQSAVIMVAAKPELKAFRVQMLYPAYTGKKNETRNSLGDISIPAGTLVNLALVTSATDNASVRLGKGSAMPLLNAASVFAFQYRFLNDTSLTVFLSNKSLPGADSYQYEVQVIPDQYPVVQVTPIKDSVTGKQILLTGTAGDDYGISKITFNTEIADKGKILSATKTPIPFKPGVLTNFQYYIDLSAYDLKPGQQLNYYVEVWDNDGVHGNKASRSSVMTFQMLDLKKIDSAINENSKQINSGLSNSAEQTKQLQTEYKEMQTKMLQSDNMNWEQQLSMKEMLNKQLDLKNQLENIKKRFEEQTKESEFKNLSDNAKEKQEDLKKQMDNLLNKELQEQIKKLQEMMQKLNKEQAMEAMKQLEQENKLFKMDMERMQQLMKQLEMQMRMEDLADKIDNMAKAEKELQDQTEANKKDDAALAKDQKDIEKKWDKLMKEDMKAIEKLGKETKKEQELDKPKEQAKEAEQEMQKSEEQLSKKDNKSAGKNQENASKKMKEMAASMKESAGGMAPQQIDIDIKATRQILSNLIRLSFDQEDLMEKVGTTAASSQAYVLNQEEQNRLHANATMIRDSMFVLSKRISKMAPTINKETTELERYLQLAVDDLENRNTGTAVAHEQFVMTHTNNLALMLNEVLANLMAMQNESNSGSAGSCSKPGGKKPKSGQGQPMSDIITEQKNLGDAMQQMMNSVANKKGSKPGSQPKDKEGEKPGEKPGNKPGDKNGQSAQKGNKGKGEKNAGGKTGGGNGESDDFSAEELARLADEQAQLRQKIQDLANQLNSKSGMGGTAKELRDIEQKMDKNESDLVNRRITQELIMRQQEIQSRLLQAEKAIRDQEQDDKRTSKKGEELTKTPPPQLQQYLLEHKQMLEMYRTVPPQLKPYYRNMVDNYFKFIGTK
jgi:hypothetical protein